MVVVLNILFMSPDGQTFLGVPARPLAPRRSEPGGSVGQVPLAAAARRGRRPSHGGPACAWDVDGSHSAARLPTGPLGHVESLVGPAEQPGGAVVGARATCSRPSWPCTESDPVTGLQGLVQPGGRNRAPRPGRCPAATWRTRHRPDAPRRRSPGPPGTAC